MSATTAWTHALAAWAIPPESSTPPPKAMGFPPSLFEWTPERAAAESEMTLSRQRAVEALGDGGSVLDVGTGGGRGSLPLAPPATLVIGVDPSPDLLAVFAKAAERLGVAYRTVQGPWPAVASEVEP